MAIIIDGIKVQEKKNNKYASNSDVIFIYKEIEKKLKELKKVQEEWDKKIQEELDFLKKQKKEAKNKIRQEIKEIMKTKFNSRQAYNARLSNLGLKHSTKINA